MQVGPGTVIGRYRIDAVAGHGGMGTVYRATHLALETHVALKLIAGHLASDIDFRERFKRESRVAASVRHPNVIRVYDAGEEDGVLFLAMEFIEGTDLRSMIRADGALDPRRAVSIVSQVAAALDAAHARGLVHRDVKPGNVLVDTEQAYLTDFGLTKELSATANITATGHWVGTLDYVAPEQILGEPIDHRADVYALGCVLYHCLTGHPPYPVQGDPAKMWAHVNKPPPVPSRIRPELAPFDQVIATAMARDPSRRSDSAGQLATAAAQALEAQPTVRDPLPPPAPAPSFPPPTPPTPLEQVDGEARPRARRKVLAITLAIAALLAAAGTVVALTAGGGGEDDPASAAASDDSSSDDAPLVEDEVRTTLASFEQSFAAEDEAGVSDVTFGADYYYLGTSALNAGTEYEEIFRDLKVRDYNLDVDSIEVTADDQARAELRYSYRSRGEPFAGALSMILRRDASGDFGITEIRATPQLAVAVNVENLERDVVGRWTCRVKGEVVASGSVDVNRNGLIWKLIPFNAAGEELMGGENIRCSYSDPDGGFNEKYDTPYSS